MVVVVVGDDLLHHLSKNAGHAPYVHPRCIVGGAQEHFRRAVPQCNDLHPSPDVGAKRIFVVTF